MGSGQQQQQRTNELGGCTLHPDIQLSHRKKNGEWRVLLHACPLCVSGLPATGHSISTTFSTEDAQDDDNNDTSVKNKEGKPKKTKKKKHKSQLDNSSHSDDGAGCSYNINQEEGEITDLDRKIQEKKMPKEQQKLQQQQLSSSSDGGGRSSRAMSRTPPKSPSARPRSPSPQQSPLHMKQRITATNNNSVYYNEPPFTLNG